MLIGHFQCQCKQGRFEENLATISGGLEKAQQMGLDILTFPESLLTGYFEKEEDARSNCFATDSPQMEQVLKETAGYAPMFLVGFNELRGSELFNSVAVIEHGNLIGTYSKAFPVYPYFSPGREFPVFQKKGLAFGVVICADGGYMEPTRILALKGARLIFAPHFNHVGDPVGHYRIVKKDHIARAVENGVYFLRANNVVDKKDIGPDPQDPRFGYGDSYLVDPEGHVVAACGVHEEYLMVYHLDLARSYPYGNPMRSLTSARALLGTLSSVISKSGDSCLSGPK